MTEAAREYGDVTRLKSLLFRNEQQAIEDIRDQLDAHHERIGSDDVMQESVSSVLAGALRDARVRQHKQVADAIAPILVEGMKREIKNSRDEMVDALYPIMGRLVSAYVSSAVADVMNQTNRKLESGLTGRFVYLRAKALLTGKSYQELAVADRQMFQINELMLIRRGSGMLIDHFKLKFDETGGGEGDEQGPDSSMVSGVVAAIHDFAQEAFSGKRSSLRSVDMGEETIYLRATSGLILAVIGRGRARRKLERALDAELVTLLEERSSDIQKLEDGDTSIKILPKVAERLMTAQMEATNTKPVLAILLVGLIGAAIAGYVAWAAYNSWQTERLRTNVMAAIAAERAFEGFPMQVDVASDRSSVRVSGFAPSVAARDRLMSALDTASGTAALKAKMNVLADAGVEPRLIAAEERLTQVVADLDNASTRLDATAKRTTLGELSYDIARLQEENRAQRADFADRAEALQKRIAALEARPTPQEGSPIGRWILDNGVFFGNGTSYRDPALARQTLSDLRQLLRDDPAVRIRVVGYADVRGRPESNSILAQERAERVAADLLGAGVSANRILAVGRASERQFSTNAGPEGGNRRVEFELLFKGE